MIDLGNYNKLTIARKTSVGLYLTDEHGNEVLLPNKFVPTDPEVGKQIEVFVYRDSEDRIVATTQQPKATLGTFAFLKVVDVATVGAFVDWGLDKHLLVPFREQSKKMNVGEYHFVCVYLDAQTDRLAGSANIGRFLSKEQATYPPGEPITIVVGKKNELGYEVIIDDQFKGLVYANEVFEPLSPGLKRQAFVKQVREDGKIDVALQLQGFSHVEDSSQKLLDVLLANDGFIPLNDKSDPHEIVETLQMSKKTFKKAVGILYKQRAIIITTNGIRIAKTD